MLPLAEFLSYSFIQRSLTAGVILAVVSALIGVFVVLRRMSFFSDAIAHASLAGVAIGLALQISPTLGAIFVSIGIAFIMANLTQRRILSSDTIIGVLFSSSIALAVFIISLLPQYRVDLTSLLFGDILVVSRADVVLAIILLLATLVIFKLYGKTLVKLTFNRDVALVEDRSVALVEYLFLGLVGFTVAVCLKIVGAVLVSALIILPAATAQHISRDLRTMFAVSVILAVIGVFLGMYFSFLFDSPSGSTIVLTLTVFFLGSFLFRKA